MKNINLIIPVQFLVEITESVDDFCIKESIVMRSEYLKYRIDY